MHKARGGEYRRVPGRLASATVNELEVSVKVEIWSDVVCPWCYIGKRRFEAALARFEHRDEVEVVWRSFELDPGARRARRGRRRADAPRRQVRHDARARRSDAQSAMTAAAAAEGLDFRLRPDAWAATRSTRTA